MTVAILGLGNMGKGLAKRLAGKTDIVIGTRDLANATTFAGPLPGNVKVANLHDAVRAADIVVLALPYGVALEQAGKLDLSGKIVVDISNPITPDYSGLVLGFDTSAAEQIQAVAKGAKVVKAFNTIFAGLFDAPESATSSIPVFLAGEEAAVTAVADIVGKAGFAVEKTGGLEAARLVEPVGMLNIRLAYGLGRGSDIAPAWLKLAA